MTEGSGRSAVRRVASARGISLTGSGAAFASLAYIVYRLTGESAVWLSVTLLLTMGLQGLVQPFASWLGDRFDRRRVLVISDLAAAAGFVALAFARTPGQLIAVAAVTAVLESPVWAVAGASIPNLIEEEHLPWANGQVAIGRHLGSFIGPLLGTQLIVWLAGAWASGDPLLHARAVQGRAARGERTRWAPGRLPVRDERSCASLDPDRVVRAPARRRIDPGGRAPLRARIREGRVRIRADLGVVGRRCG